MSTRWIGMMTVALALLMGPVAVAQVAPTAAERVAYRGLFAAAASDDGLRIGRLLRRGDAPNTRDGHGRTPLMVAAHGGARNAARALLVGHADPNLLDGDRYDIVTIAAVSNDPAMIRLAVKYGAKATNITSRYDGTALIAASHLGNVEAVRELIRAKAPLDHVNNLGWTALLEAIILGDGGPRHTEVVRMLIAARASPFIADRAGVSPLEHARRRGYDNIVTLFNGPKAG